MNASNAFVRKVMSHGRLSRDEMALIYEVSQKTRLVPRQANLIREGARSDGVFIIMSGWACRQTTLKDGTRQITAFLLPGDFTDLHDPDINPPSHSVTTITECLVTHVPYKAMEAVATATPALVRAFKNSQHRDIDRLHQWVINVGRRDSIARVAYLMLELYYRLEAIGETRQYTCSVPLIQSMIADALGITTVHCNRMLGKLRAEGILEHSNSKLTIVDIKRLVKIADFHHPQPPYQLGQTAPVKGQIVLNGHLPGGFQNQHTDSSGRAWCLTKAIGSSID